MTQDKVIRMAIQCQLVNTSNRDGIYMDALQDFAKLVAAAEREACAKLVEVSDDVADWEIICGSDGRVLLNAMAKEIRARGEA